MYLQTLSTSDFETENADADSCQAKTPWANLWSFYEFGSAISNGRR